MSAIIKLSQNEWVMFFVQDGWNQVGRIQDGCHHQVQWEWMSLSQNELVWVRVRVEGDVFELIWEKKTRCLNSTMQKLNPRWQNSRWAKFKMATIIKLSQNEWVKFSCANVGKGSVCEVFFVQMVGTNLGTYECVWEEKLRWLNPRWWNSWWLPSSS